MKSSTRKTVGSVGALLVAGALALGCGALQQEAKTAKDVVKLADDACVLIHDIAPNNEKGQEICAREDELRPYFKLILGARAKAAASPPVVPVDAGKD